ncbi:low temperature requirement protein A [Micromonospora mirobrigensis]|uniref:Low temperature requirement protein LtrA n=1 Tax=Micromonospora mirobrigensis TaxID=262898 RepID=A0A1C5AL07_9ACTN|nr:low temperature requirement protein A [Micromonospora mirobrigensis]SCF45922.1 Low temperature requirement protein LtrA [Micromonospora mirobrigensis]
MRAPHRHDPSRAPADRVTPVEVFFDVVFVFTLTQLTRVLEADLTPAGFGRVVLLFGILWWMFDGYVGLANHVPPRSPAQKLLLFLGMGGFLIAAVGIPRAYTDTGLVFGVGYLVVICVHLLLFTQADIGRALWWLAAYNLGSALLVVAGGLTAGATRYALWLVAFAVQSVVPYLVPRFSWVRVQSLFRIQPSHLIERHGLLVIIALGESVVAIGMGVDVEHLTAGTVAVIGLALALPAALWWTYFTDTPAVEAALVAVGPDRRVGQALRLLFAHIPLLLGIVVAAAGVHAAVAHPGDPTSWQSATALSGGTTLYLAATIAIRRSLRIAPVRSRVITAVAVLGTVPVGLATNGALHLAALVIVVVVMLVVDRRYHAAQTLREA